MAKFEKNFDGEFSEFLNCLQNDITNGSISVSYKDGSNITMSDVKIAVRVFENYSMTGVNRVSLNITLVGVGNKLFLSAITSGGSKTIFVKMSKYEESSFIKICKVSVEKYLSQKK